MTISAILLAAGRGRRMGRQGNKVFLPVAGKLVLTRAAASLCRTPRIDELIVVAHPTELALAAEAMPPLDIPVRVVAGGEERQDSALAGVAVAVGDLVLVHDAARPFPSPELVERVIDGVHRYGACIPVIVVVDTLRRVGRDGLVTHEVVDRGSLVCVQTPQGFRTELLRRALTERRPCEASADDAAAVLALGLPVGTVEGDRWNIKITTPADLDFASCVALWQEES
jgi:2-C-methyl-D-erythritol 4-phosphate cytidylyltransferase